MSQASQPRAGANGSPPSHHTIVFASGERIRQVTVTRPALWLGSVAGAALLAAAVVVPAWMLAANQQAEAGALASETHLRRGYETRIADLRAQLDRASSQRALSENLVRTRVAELSAEQQDLAERYATLRLRVERAEAVGVLPPNVPVPEAAPPRETADLASDRSAHQRNAGGVGGPFEPSGLRGTLGFLGSNDADGIVVPGATENRVPNLVEASAAADTIGDPAERLAAMAVAIDRQSDRQVSDAIDLAYAASARADRVHAALRSAGIAVESSDAKGGVGGPFEPIETIDDFNEAIDTLDVSLTRLESAEMAVRAVPTRLPRPLDDRTSAFGFRKDPFLGQSAFHSGIDFAGPQGAPIPASGSGKVVEAGRAGGYGNRVTIDHGHGLTTRYAHMASIAVKVGDAVDAGQTIGRLGSTGRSTGPHIHYEVRRDGRAIDPMRLRRLGVELAELRS